MKAYALRKLVLSDYEIHFCGWLCVQIPLLINCAYHARVRGALKVSCLSDIFWELYEFHFPKI